MLDGPLTQEPWIRLLKSINSDSGAIFDQPRKIYYVQDPVSKAFEVGGYYRSDDKLKFTFLTIPKSGHFVPITQQLASRNFVNDIAQQGKLVCHKDKPEDCDTGAIMCSFMKGCSTAGECDVETGRCKCYGPYINSDCSDIWWSLPYNGPFDIDGVNWLHFHYEQILSDLDEFEFQLTS